MTAQHIDSIPGRRFHPIAQLFPLLEGEAFDALAADIGVTGLLEPIIEYEGQILDGRNRYRACIQANREPRFMPFEGDDPLVFVLSKNLQRRHLNESQRAMIMARIATLSRGGDRSNPPRGVLQVDAAKTLHIGVRSGQRAKVVLERGVPELVRRVEQGSIPVKVAAEVAKLSPEVQEELVGQPEAKLRGAIKSVARARREQQLATRTAAAAQSLGATLYSVIYADPPWRFEPFSRETGLDRAADNHYPTVTTSDIAKLSVPAAPDCALFLWATAPMLPEALDVMRAWGFTYRTQLVWIKDRIGTGYWCRSRHEILLIGIRGDVPAPAPGQQPESVITAAIARHSEKPACFTEMIKQMFPNGSRIELFARSPRPGWDVWGNEVANESAPGY